MQTTMATSTVLSCIKSCVHILTPPPFPQFQLLNSLPSSRRFYILLLVILVMAKTNKLILNSPITHYFLPFLGFYRPPEITETKTLYSCAVLFYLWSLKCIQWRIQRRLSRVRFTFEDLKIFALA